MYRNEIESNSADFMGTMEAAVIEVGGTTPKNVIRTTQDFYVKVDWEMHGPVVEWVDADFRIEVLLERFGTGDDIDLPVVHIGTLSAPLVPTGSGTIARHYSQNINVGAGQVAEGVYQIVTCLQLIERGSGNPTPIAGFSRSGVIRVFKPSA